jgi:hypothetical protein
MQKAALHRDVHLTAKGQEPHFSASQKKAVTPARLHQLKMSGSKTHTIGLYPTFSYKK